MTSPEVRVGDVPAQAGRILPGDDASASMMSRELADNLRLQGAVLEVLDEGVVVLDVHRRLLQANRAACAILGLDLASARADPSWWKIIAARHPSDGSSLEVAPAVLRTGQGVRDVDVEAAGPDGTSILLSANYQALRDEAGTVSGLVVSFRDVTEREFERRRSAEAQDRLREAHEVARLSSWELQPETGEVVVFHALPEEEAAVPEASVTFESVLVAMAPEDRKQARDDVAAIVRGDRDESVRRHAYSFPTGPPVWMETRMRAVRDGDGRLECIRGTSQDVSEQELAEQHAARERDFLQATLDSLSAHIAVLGQSGEILMTNRAWTQFGAANGAAAPAVGENYLAACDGAAGDAWAKRSAAGLRTIMSGVRDDFSLEYPYHGPTAERWFTLRAARFEGPGDAHVVVAREEVTKRHQAEGEVATQAALLDEVDVAVIATGPDGYITHWNRGAEELHGWTYAEVVGRDAATFISAPDVGAGEPIVGLHRTWDGEHTVRHKNGSTFPAYLRGRVRLDHDGRPAGWVGVSVDLSKRVESERAERAAGNYLRAVADSMGEGLFTLDNEGLVTYMNEAAEKLLGWSRDDLMGRFMHDLTHAWRPDGSVRPIEDCPIMHARRDGQSKRVEDDTFIRHDGRELPVAYTAAPFETDDGVQGCVVVFEDISERKAHAEWLLREAEKLSWIGRIQDAIAQDRFVLYAQPIVDLAGGAVVQHELLLRMREPTGEIVLPGVFLPIAEKYGLIGEIDRWVIGHAVELVTTGHPVEVNLSARSVGRPEVLDHIEHCIEKTGADPTLLVFEITETALIEDQVAARNFFEHLHNLGCKIALDDFGTGYAGFTYLKQLPLDYLKIDVEFVRDLATNPDSSHVVQAVVALACGFGLQTIAEGVEDARTLDMLRELGVDFAQGYHIARPGPVGESAIGSVGSGPMKIQGTGNAHE